MAASMSSQLFGIGFVLVLVQISKKLDLENPDNLQYLRLAYSSAQVIIFSILYTIYSRIQAKNDQTELKYEEKKPMSQDPPTEIVTTVHDYDIGELKKQLQSSVVGIGILCLLHFKFNYVQPLFLQTILPFKNLLDANIVKVHLLGKEAEGDLKRPWKAASMFDMPQETTEEQVPAVADGAARHGLTQANITELPEKKDTETKSTEKESKADSSKSEKKDS